MNEAQRVIELARLKLLLVQAKVSIVSSFLMYALCYFLVVLVAEKRG
jgi:hypothetical protein